MGYEGTNVYIIRIQSAFKDVFQYLAVWDKEIFQNNVVLNHSWRKLLLYWLGLFPRLDDDEIRKIEQVMLSGAMKTIDELKHPSHEVQKTRRKALKRRIKTTCNWQIHMDGQDKYWMCLNHQDQHGSPWLVKMEDGKAPQHTMILNEKYTTANANQR